MLRVCKKASVGARKENRKNESKSRRHIENHSEKNERRKNIGKKRLLQLATRAPMLYIKSIFHFLFSLCFAFSICNVTCQPGIRSLFVARIFRLRTNFTGKKYRHKYRHKRTILSVCMVLFFSFSSFSFQLPNEQ